MKFYQTSAKTGMGIQDAFDSIARSILEKKEEKKTIEPIADP